MATKTQLIDAGNSIKYGVRKNKRLTVYLSTNSDDSIVDVCHRNGAVLFTVGSVQDAKAIVETNSHLFILQSTMYRDNFKS